MGLPRGSGSRLVSLRIPPSESASYPRLHQRDTDEYTD